MSLDDFEEQVGKKLKLNNITYIIHLIIHNQQTSFTTSKTNLIYFDFFQKLTSFQNYFIYF